MKSGSSFSTWYTRVSLLFPISFLFSPPWATARRGPERGVPYFFEVPFLVWGSSCWDGGWMIVPFCSTPLSLWFIPILIGFSWGVPSLVGAGSSYVACSATMLASSPPTVGRKITNHPTCPTLQRSCSNWGHPASYFFTGDPAAFPESFAFLVGGSSVLTRLIPNLRSPATVRHRALRPYSPSTANC